MEDEAELVGCRVGTCKSILFSSNKRRLVTDVMIIESCLVRAMVESK